MANDSSKESKSIGRNIFAENQPDFFKEKTGKNQPDPALKKRDSAPKSIGRNIFSEAPNMQSPSSRPADIGEDLKIIEKSTKGVSKEKSSSTHSSSKKGRVNALHITKDNVVFAQTEFDGINYRLTNLQVFPIEPPQITEENILKDKKDPEQVIKELQIDAVEKAFVRAGVAKNDPLIVTSLNGTNVIVKQVYVQNTPVENIEKDLPSILKSPFDAMSRYEYIILNSDGMNHDVHAAVSDGSTFFSIQAMLAITGIECQIMDVDKIAIVNLYNESVRPPKGNVSCVMDIGNDYSHIMIIPSGNEELYIRNIDFTYNTFKKTLQRNRDISIAETEEMLKNRNFYDYITNAFEQETTENLNQHFSVKKEIRMKLLREIQKTFQYYAQQNQNKIPSKIYITGKALEMNKFAQFINKNTDIPCENLDISGFFVGDSSVIEYAKEKESVAYVAIGLALRYE
ncbi:MAG: pilus assembly protein PilM [Candidatus Delongbacteria bacterium]